MERRNFLTSSIMGGMTILNSTSALGQQKEQPKPFYIPPRESLTHGPGNVDTRTIINSPRTNMQFSNVEVAIGPKQMGPSPHIHKDLDELMYVLEGTATVMIGNEIFEVKAGGWNFRPRGIMHTFWNGQATPLRFIDCFFNQPFEDYLDELFHDIIPYMIKNKMTPASPEIAKRMNAIDEKFGVLYFHEKRQAIVDKYGLNG